MQDPLAPTDTHPAGGHDSDRTDRRPGPPSAGSGTCPIGCGRRGGARPGRWYVSDDGVVVDRVLTIPNALSLLRLLLVPVFFWLILGGHDAWALVVLMASGVSDYLDGT